MALTAPAIAQDQDRGGRPDGRGQDNRDSRDSQAYRTGYQEGMRDMQRGKASRPNDRRWKSDYDRNAYRSGYQAGYNQAGTNRQLPNRNDGYGPYGRGGYGQNAATELQRQAQQNGYTDGVYYAQKDMQSRHNNNPVNCKGYKDADHNYNSSLGSKGEFQRIYREAFIEGYRRTYR
jgi:hypothetical protein